MSIREDLDIAGRLTLRMYGADGRLAEERVAHNDITLKGRELVARLFNADLAATDIPRVSRIVVGGDDHAFNPNDKGLGKRVGSTRITSIAEEDVTDGSGKPRKLLRLTGELGEKDSNAELREAGLFTENEELMYNRVTFKPINKSAEFKLTLVWEITF
ncbi:MAG TPA: hypothetical protein VFJ82_12280 [Longimicrobium sp.]|nr:hypothetical protein [Longimicrobium sp.]